MEKTAGASSIRFWKDPILLLILGTVIGLSLIEGVLGVIYGQGQVLGEWPPFVPMMNGFIALAAICIAFLAFGRYHAIRDPTFYWVGMGFACFGLGQIFFILSWPGVLPDNRSLIARLPGTSLWIGEIAKTLLILALLAAIVGRWPLENLLRGRRWLASVAVGIGLTVLICGLMVLLERDLPVVVSASGRFTAIALTWEGAIVVVMAFEVLASTRLYRTTREPFLGYLAVGLVAFALGAVTALIGTKRYDLWFYLYRVIVVYSLLVLLFGLLSEFPRLIRLERESQARVAAEREWFQTTLASIGDAVITTDAQGKITYLNTVAEQLTGWLHQEASGMRVEQVVNILSEQAGQLVNHPVVSVLQKGVATRLTNHTVIINRSGQIVPIEQSVAPIRVGSGPLLGVVMVLHDMTEKRKAEQVLADSEARYRNLFNRMTEGFALNEIMFDDDGKPFDYRFLEINPAFEQLTGLNREEVQGKRMSQIPQLQMADPKWVDLYGQVVLTGEPVHFENYSPVLQRNYEVFAYRPAPGQLAVIFIDITKRKQSEEEALTRAVQIELQQHLLDQREQERQQIARDLHDGPVQELTGATFALRILLMDIRTPEVAQQLEAIQATLQGQINELRTYAAELRPTALEKFGLVKAIQSHLDTFQEKHPEYHIRFEDHSEGPILPEEIRLALFRIFQEAMNNITKHARATEVTIRFTKTLTQAVLEIQDNGIGFKIPKDWVELARNKHLGLVGIRERAEAVGSKLEIQSQPGQGTRIRINVPVGEPGGKLP